MTIGIEKSIEFLNRAIPVSSDNINENMDLIAPIEPYTQSGYYDEDREDRDKRRANNSSLIRHYEECYVSYLCKRYNRRELQDRLKYCKDVLISNINILIEIEALEEMIKNVQLNTIYTIEL